MSNPIAVSKPPAKPPLIGRNGPAPQKLVNIPPPPPPPRFHQVSEAPGTWFR